MAKRHRTHSSSKNRKAREIRRAKTIRRKTVSRPAKSRPARKTVRNVARRATRITKITKRIKAKGKIRKKIKPKEAAVMEERVEDKFKINEIIEKVSFSDFISQNVGKRAIDIIRLLHTPQTDEKVAAELDIKINEVRRILNVLDGYGVARYDTSRDSKGWLTFRWYLDREKLVELNTAIETKKLENSYTLPEDCNDFFYCTKCYSEQKIILPFDAAFESRFKCDTCGSKLKLLSRGEATRMFEQESVDKKLL